MQPISFPEHDKVIELLKLILVHLNYSYYHCLHLCKGYLTAAKWLKTLSHTFQQLTFKLVLKNNVYIESLSIFEFWQLFLFNKISFCPPPLYVPGVIAAFALSPQLRHCYWLSEIWNWKYGLIDRWTGQGFIFSYLYFPVQSNTVSRQSTTRTLRPLPHHLW